MTTREEALSWFDSLMDEICCRNCQPLHIKCIQSQPEHETIRAALSPPPDEVGRVSLPENLNGKYTKEIHDMILHGAASLDLRNPSLNDIIVNIYHAMVKASRNHIQGRGE